MLKTILVLPDGSELSSGPSRDAAIQSVTLTECVSESTDLMPGAVCAQLLEAKILALGGSLFLESGDEVTLYRQEGDVRHQVGIFRLEKPTRSGANSLSLTAYDRVSLLDKDMTSWLKSLDGWPYSLLSFVQMVCSQAGLGFANTSIPNGDYEVPLFTGEGLTGRRLIRWAAQIAGCFCRATPEGKLEFAWYTPSGVTLTPGGERSYFQNGLTFEDYQTPKIARVRLQLTREDVGVSWPEAAGEAETLAITGNYLLAAGDTQALQPVAQTLYERLKDISYTPCRVSLPAGMDIRAGQTVQVRDANGRTFTLYVMTKVQSGQKDTLECTGNPTRDSAGITDTEQMTALTGKMLEISKEVEGLSVRATETRGDLSSLTEHVADLQLQAGELQLRVASVDSATGKKLSSVSSAVTKLQKEVSARMTSEQVALEIQKAQESGAEKVTTKTGFTFDETGLTVEKSGTEMKTQITENGMSVYQNDVAVLTANNQGVDAKNLHATTYLIVGENSRFQDYGDGRTGCFWIGGA